MVLTENWRLCPVTLIDHRMIQVGNPCHRQRQLRPCHVWILQKNTEFQLFPKVSKQKIEADRGVSPRATGEAIPPFTAPAAAGTPAPTPWLAGSVILPPHPRSPHPQAARSNRGLCRLFLPPFPRHAGGARAAMPTHHGRGWQVGQSSRARAPSQQITRDLCSPVWVTGRSQQPQSVPHAAAVPSPPWPLVNKEV